MMKMISTAFESEPPHVGRRVLVTLAMLLLVLPITASGEEKQSQQEEKQMEPQLSVFAVPLSLKEGRDPFYPKSTRVIESNTKRPPRVVVAGPAILELKGISGTAARPLALINNQTFAVGDKQHVNTDAGRVEVLCLDIEGTTVRIKAQGQTRELMLRKGI
jgi:hypothetical protein